jgi:hypothetical protein
LQERPTIEVVSRDRCGLYAQAAPRARLKPARWLTAFIWFKI